jgi:lysozyme
MNIRKIIKEEIGDFDWAKGDVYFTIDDIIGKQMYYRKNNIENKVLTDLNRGDVELGDIRWDKGWVVKEVLENGMCLLLLDKDKTTTTGYRKESVEAYVNLGAWVLLDNDGNILNDFSNKINESEYYLNKVIKKLSLLKEDGKTEPDMEWDFTQIKQDLDKSKQWVKTAEDVKKYLTLLFQKIKNLPKKTKLKILKYVLISFIGLISLKELSSITKEVSPEKIDLVLSDKSNKDSTHILKKNIKIRKTSNELIDHLKWEEGSIKEKGKPVLTAYDLGDGAYTIGYGHAVFSDPSRGDNGGKYDFLPKYNKILPGKTKITPQQAEILLKDDIKIAEEGLNKILNDWDKMGINPSINQKMYDAMISMIFNMGIQNFRMSDFIQMVKKGDLKSASNEIKNISSNMFNKYPGLKIRREKEYELFRS